MDRYVCVHGHAYQPPRENPWLEAVEVQDSAFPFHDWNERVTAECYEPNTASRILTRDGRIAQIINNYSRMSFNFGATLLSWMEWANPTAYAGILAADQESRERFGGHGSAVAQAHGHIIMPLANDRDRRTQTIWGIRDFEHRFGRTPDGMWLPETAANTASLEALAEQGIRFTIMAPHQAARIRKLGEEPWTDVSGARIDPARAYTVNLPSGRSIAVFFYDGPISRAVAFEGLLDDGETFAQRLVSGFDDARGHTQLAHIATDDESYGHHHRHGEMALSYALDYVESRGLARLTNYSQFLEIAPPEYEAGIIEDTSWSCAHGVERWRSNCGCNTGRPGWHQEWRAPLRQALDTLRDTIAPEYERQAGALLADPWAARDDYIDVMLDRSDESLRAFLAKHATHELTEDETTRALKLLELQRHAMLMYTSCGWFFDDISGIETVQVIMYAGRVIQLAGDVLGLNDIEAPFVAKLSEAPSNVPEHQNGGVIYERWVKPATVDLRAVAAHYAVDQLFVDDGKATSIYCYRVEPEENTLRQTGGTRLVLGRARLISDITRESALITYCILHLGDQNVNGGVRAFQGDEAYDEMKREVLAAFERADYPEIIRLQERHFEGAAYSLRSLFRDEQREVVQHILNNTLEEIEGAYRNIYDTHLPLMLTVADLNFPLPKVFTGAADAIVNADLRRALKAEQVEQEQIGEQLRLAGRLNLTLDEEELKYIRGHRLSAAADAVAVDPAALGPIGALTDLLTTTEALPFDVDLWRPQNVIYDILHSEQFGTMSQAADTGDTTATQWRGLIMALCDRLHIATDGV